MEMNRKEKYNSVNYLTGLAQCIIRKNTLIELQNDTSVAGKVVGVDGFMNVTMENVVYIDQLGQQYLLDNFVIYSKYIRYIHIPKEINMKASFEDYINSTKGRKKPVDKKLTFKQKRAQQAHYSTLVENKMV
ncbi:U7 snRNA-associated Sm-like protein LSm10 [Anopheles maculipalpis]|uniref:U7 snRNA-associated Sm-like protein LSm10 n=1 Tax=Anopheles maculipalpis TaxID=1496333 RepID=UPI002159A4FF|nr:U7 snRNA-associated Sm-like protein LSm10 [Anopheles maculipalpis]